MLKSLVLGSLLGGLVLFIWGAVSWMVLPWHMATLKKFKDEGAVAQVFVANAPESGEYILPNAHQHESGLPDAQRKAAEESAMTRMMQGPFMFSSISLRGTKNMGTSMGIGMANQILAALLATGLLLKTAGLTFGGRVGFVMTLGLLAGVVINLQHWNWWQFSTAYTAVAFGDLLIGWFLAGLVIAKVVPAR